MWNYYRGYFYTSEFFLYKYLQDHPTLSLGTVSETIFSFFFKFHVI